ncbi:MAG: hypothetical protein FD146_2248 [Anaerolineaceae bacterium]|nr:MAG: hypothetical protein FD146_2248 [Anaerolineaceae bacterium]
MGYIKNHKLALMLTGIAILTILRIAIPFYSGYSGKFSDLFLFFVEPFRYILIVSCTIIIITINLIRKRKVSAFLVVVFFIFIGLIPTGHFTTLGALLSIHNANPEQFRNDAREVLDEYGSNTIFSDSPQRVLNQYDQFPRNKIPPSILRADVGDVFVLDEYILIEKFGLGGSFRGFIVFREGSDIWKNEKSYTLLEGCSYCWKIRIVDGLYWYHAAPVAEEDATVDFLSK